MKARLLLGLAGAWAVAFVALAQDRPYIGFVYPAGGQQGTTFPVRLGGQGLDGVNGVLVTGTGVTAKLDDYYRRLDMEELQLLSEQLYQLRQETLSPSALALNFPDDARPSRSRCRADAPRETRRPRGVRRTGREIQAATVQLCFPHAAR